jgi:hypothetical protein
LNIDMEITQLKKRLKTWYITNPNTLGSMNFLLKRIVNQREKTSNSTTRSN